jgi:hypothetical protein
MSAVTHRTVAISIQATIRRDGANRIIAPPHPIAASVASPVTGVLPAIAFPLCGDSAMMFHANSPCCAFATKICIAGVMESFCLLP